MRELELKEINFTTLATCRQIFFFYMTELLDKFQEAGAKERVIDSLPSRIKYYLLEWRDKNMDIFIERYGNVSLGSLSKEQLKVLFDNATMSDLQLFTFES